VIDARTLSVLPYVLQREGRSLLQYAGEMYPWAPPEEAGVWAQVKKMVREQADAAASVVRFLTRRRVTPPGLGGFPKEYTGLGFVSLDHLLPMLAREERQGVAALERDLAALTDGEAKDLVQKILEQKRGHLKALEALAAAHPEAVKH
jgi:rubrerythrin